MIIVFTVMSKVNLTRVKMLMLFTEIPNQLAELLAGKCEEFLCSLEDEDNNNGD